MSLGEIVLLLLVGIIVVGPRNLPSMMRTAGQWVAKLRRMSTELRSQSGIDDLLRREGLDEHLHDLRSLSRLNVVDTLMSSAASSATTSAAAASMTLTARKPAGSPSAKSMEWKRDAPLREREYPLIGCDAYGALPDDATPYHAPPAAIADDAPPPVETAIAETAIAETAPAETAIAETAPAETAVAEAAPVEAAATETAPAVTETPT